MKISNFPGFLVSKRKSYYACSSLCFLKQFLQRTGLSPFGWKGTVSSAPQLEQVIGKDCLGPLSPPAPPPPLPKAARAFTLQSLQRKGALKPFC